MKEIRLTTDITEPEADKLCATFLDPTHYDVLVTDSANVYKPNGDLLFAYRKHAIAKELCEVSYPVFRDAARPSNNRGIAAGKLEDKDALPGDVNPDQKSMTRFRQQKADGTTSNTSRGKEVMSSVIGYFDRAARFPYCRLTSYNLDNPGEFAKVMPFIRHVNEVFKDTVPERHAAQMEFIRRTHPEFVIHGTAFTTVTVNKNFQTAVHKDAGDLKEGFGVLSCMRGGHYTGGHLVFPRYRAAVDLGTGDVLCADVHEWHGNTRMHGKLGTFERISLVFYYREKMIECGSPEEEAERANQKRNAIA